MKGLSRYLRLPLLLTLLILLVLPGVTNAALLCRSDPRVALSNGVMLFVGASIEAQLQDITRVNYEVHVPSGVTMTNVIHTPGWAWDVETFTLVADQKPDQYRVFTTVSTRLNGADVLAYTTVLDDGLRTTYTTLGEEDQKLAVSFSS